MIPAPGPDRCAKMEQGGQRVFYNSTASGASRLLDTEAAAELAGFVIHKMMIISHLETMVRVAVFFGTEIALVKDREGAGQGRSRRGGGLPGRG